MSPSRRWTLIHCASFLIVGLLGCKDRDKPAGEGVVIDSQPDALTSFLEQRGYTPFTPFRTDDKPGTMFVIAANHLGRFTEFTFSEHDSTFDVPGGILYDDPSDVTLPSQLTQEFNLSGSASLDFVHLPISAEAAGQYVQSAKMEVGSARKYVIPIDKAVDHLDDVADRLRERLRVFERYGQISDVFLVLETLEVDSISVKISFKATFLANAEFTKIKKFADVNANANIINGNTLEIRTDEARLIAYKACRFPTEALQSATSVSGHDLEYVKPSDIRDIKGI